MTGLCCRPNQVSNQVLAFLALCRESDEVVSLRSIERKQVALFSARLYSRRQHLRGALSAGDGHEVADDLHGHRGGQGERCVVVLVF